MDKISFVSGEYFVYVSGDKFELGRVKRKVSEDTYACYYHLGETAAMTSVSNMHKLENGYVIESAGLGGDEGSKLFG